MYTKNCAHCGKEFIALKPRGLYCSGRCKSAYRKANGAPNALCAHCGKPYFRVLSRIKYCSNECGNSANAGKCPTKTLTCVDCGITFTFTGRTTKRRCDSCKANRASMQTMLSKAKRIPTTRIGIGSGGGQHWDPSKGHRGRVRNGDSSKTTVPATVRSYLLRSRGYCCERCGFSMQAETLYTVHHIDMDTTNNEDSNLGLLCHNCHRILHLAIRKAFLPHGPRKQLCIDTWLAEVKSRN